MAGTDASVSANAPNANAIRNAITTAISEYQKERFRFSDINPGVPTSFVTVPGQSVYTVAANAQIASMYFIEYINIVIGATLQELGRVTPERQHLNIQTNNQNGFPSSFAYEGNSLILYPVPDIVYTLYIGGHLFVAAPATDAETGNPWMTTAELLIRCRAKYELSLHVTRNYDMAGKMSPDPQENGATYRAWKSLKGSGNKITGTGKIRPMRF